MTDNVGGVSTRVGACPVSRSSFKIKLSVGGREEEFRKTHGIFARLKGPMS